MGLVDDNAGVAGFEQELACGAAVGDEPLTDDAHAARAAAQLLGAGGGVRVAVLIDPATAVPDSGGHGQQGTQLALPLPEQRFGHDDKYWLIGPEGGK